MNEDCNGLVNVKGIVGDNVCDHVRDGEGLNIKVSSISKLSLSRKHHHESNMQGTRHHLKYERMLNTVYEV